MNLGIDFRRGLDLLPLALENMVARINAIWSKEHNADGSHGNITADSVVITGPETGSIIGGALRAEGDTSALANPDTKSIDLGQTQAGASHIWARTSTGGLDSLNIAASPVIMEADATVQGKLKVVGVVEGGPLRADGQIDTLPNPATNAIDIGRYSTTPYIWSRTSSGANALLEVAAAPLSVVGAVSITGPPFPARALEVNGTNSEVRCHGQFVVEGGTSLATGAVSGVFNFNGGLTTAQGVVEYGRSFKQGDWVSVAFNAANFTAIGGTTPSWTLAAGHVSSNFYTVIGHTAIYSFQEFGGAIGGTGVTELRILIPGGFTAAANAGHGGAWFWDGAGTLQIMIVEAKVSVNYITIRKATGGTIAAGASGGLYFQIMFPI